ncbi:hypothetical protein JYU34_016617 [Plutella xylostella]|uniref:Uncharacterized protein n=1 Tax=Plutella xylostella TaxID=51655 RepID=A0ABQ7Q3C8_PLUXY|nr:hypothetical protein JYU34_016617 [Plutella xylostella]
MASKVVTVSLFYIFCFNLVASNPLTKDYHYNRVGADQNERLSSNPLLQNRQFNSNPQQYEDPNKPSKPGPWNFKNLSVQQKLLIENLLRKQFLERNKQWTASQYNRPVQKTSYSTLPNSGQTVKIENPHRLPVTGNPPSFVNNNHNTNTQRFAPVNIANLQNNRNGMTANEVKPLYYGSNKPDSYIINKSVLISESGILNTGQSGNKVKSIQQYGSVNSHNHAENLGIKPVTNNANAQSTFTTALQGFKSGSNNQKIMSYADVLKLLQSTNINGNNGERTSVVTNQYNTQTALVPDPSLLSSVPAQVQNTEVHNSASVPITSVPASREFFQKPSTFKPIPAPPASSSVSSTSSITSTESLPSQPKPSTDATVYSESASYTSSETVVQPSPLLIETKKTENDSQEQTKNHVNSEATVITSESTSGAPENIIITSESAVKDSAAGGEDDDSYDDGDDDDEDDEDFPPSMWFSTSDPSFLTKLFGNAPLGVVYFYNAPKPIPEIDQ